MVELFAELHKAAVYPCGRDNPAWRTLDAGPPELWAIAGLIDLLLHHTEWEPKKRKNLEEA